MPRMNFPPPMDILVLTDLHYTEQARHACPTPARKSSLGLDLARKALARLRADEIEPHLILLLGDLVDNGDAPGARRDLERLAGAILSTGIRTLAIPGNHDGDPAVVRPCSIRPPGCISSTGTASCFSTIDALMKTFSRVPGIRSSCPRASPPTIPAYR